MMSSKLISSPSPSISISTFAGFRKKETAAAKPFLQVIREQKGISQRCIARAAGLSRSYIQRIESKPWQELSLNELELFACGLGMPFEELIRRGQSHLKGDLAIARASLTTPFVLDRVAKGAAVGSLIRDHHNCFAGTLILEPQQGIHKEQTPGGEFLFCYVLQGTLLLSLSSKEHVFKEQECFSFPSGSTFYELFNPHQVQKSIVLMIALEDRS